MKIVKLKWTEEDTLYPDIKSITARIPFGSYDIYKGRLHYQLVFSETFKDVAISKSLKELKRIAQNDFNERVTACIEEA